MDKFKEDLLQGPSPQLIKRVASQNKNLKKRFDNEILAKQNLQTNLKEIYKPITDTQQLTNVEIGKQTTKTDVLFQQLLTDLNGKHDGSSRLLTDIINGLARSDEETRKQGLDIVSAIAKQPLLPELIKELSKHTDLIKKIRQPGDLQNLTDQDRKVLEPLSHLNDNDLKTLVDYYILQEKTKSLPDTSVYEDVLGEEDLVADHSFQTNPINSHTYDRVMTTLKKRNAGIPAKENSPIFYRETNDPDIVKFYGQDVLFKDDKIKIGINEYTMSSDLELLMNRTQPIVEKMDVDNLKTYLRICREAGFDYTQHATIGKKLAQVLTKLNEMPKGKKVDGKGLNTIILPDNVEDLQKRLSLLIGEYFAGNKSMFNEINAILDIFLKKGIISKSTLRNILRKIKE